MFANGHDDDEHMLCLSYMDVGQILHRKQYIMYKCNLICRSSIMHACAANGNRGGSNALCSCAGYKMIDIQHVWGVCVVCVCAVEERKRLGRERWCGMSNHRLLQAGWVIWSVERFRCDEARMLLSAWIGWFSVFERWAIQKCVPSNDAAQQFLVYLVFCYTNHSCLYLSSVFCKFDGYMNRGFAVLWSSVYMHCTVYSVHGPDLSVNILESSHNCPYQMPM